MVEKKPKSNIASFWEKMTPEERKAYRKKQTENRLKNHFEKKAKKAELLRQAEAFMPQIMAQNLISAEDSTWVPDQPTIDRVNELISGGMSPDEVRRKIGASDKSWAKISKVLFSSVEPNAQNIGLQLRNAKLDAVLSARKMVRTIEKEIAAHRKNQRLRNKNSKEEYIRKQSPTIPGYLLTALAKANQDKLFAENEYARILQFMGVHDKKTATPTITIKTTIPRPGDAPVIDKVTATKRVTLEEAMEELSNGS